MANSDCNESGSADYLDHYGNLQENLQQFQLDPTTVPLNGITLYVTIGLLLDRGELSRLFGSTICCNSSPAWYNLSSDALFKSLYQLVVNTLQFLSQFLL